MQEGEYIERVIYHGGKLNGVIKMWYSNGNANIQCVYRDDKYHGKYRKWVDSAITQN
jgi:antitoxin component YwqK of YwqJK toxin-antitoxin module